MGLFSRRSEAKPSTRTDTPDHTDASGRLWTGSDYDEARANGRRVASPDPYNQPGAPVVRGFGQPHSGGGAR
ncbi:hypothetical protein [Kitasatospora sp. NPDC059327]|uniref:hypothetical protein n=1 Tax=Kitasatospora sp. NPDC059327 TaxID=3346803 RepID=UPI0036D19EDC